MPVTSDPNNTNSDAYIDESGCEAYWADRNDSTFASVTAAAQAAALREATQYLDGKYDWIGDIDDTDQLLNWPRTNAEDSEGRTLTGYPIKLQYACCELAKIALDTNLLTPVVGGGTTGQVQSEKVGDIEVSYFEGSVTKQTYAYVDSLVKSISLNNGSTSRLVRA